MSNINSVQLLYHHNIYSISIISSHMLHTHTKEKKRKQKQVCKFAIGRASVAKEMMMSQQQKQMMMRKTRTFQLQKTPSSIQEHPFTAPDPIDHQYHSTSTSFVPKRSPRPVEYPTSPENIFGQEIIHYSHPQHSLKMVDIRDLFICGGCKEYGSGKRFACQQCEFQLHDFCAFAPPALKAHPLHSQHSLLFHLKPAKSGKSKCDVCGKPTKGSAFICTACGFQMHPCCAMLNTEIDYKPHPHTLEILPATVAASAADSAGAIVCGECKKKRSGRVYQCTVCNYYLHAVCAKSKINGLQANNIKAPERPSPFAAAARVASQVVIEFIGGLVEGLGEGVGEVLVQNIAKGNGNEANTSSSTRTRPR